MKTAIPLFFVFLFGLVICVGLHARAVDAYPEPAYIEKSWQTFQRDETHIGVNKEYDATKTSDIIGSYPSTCEIAGTPTTITGADVDGDGYVELVYGCTNRRVIRAIRYGGTWREGDVETLVSWKEFPIPHGFVSSPVTMSNIDERSGYDGLEMVFGTTNGYLTVLNSDFSEITSTHACDGAIYSTPSISDMDSDGRVDIILSCTDGSIYRYSYSQGSLIFEGVASLASVSPEPSMQASQTLVYHEGSKVIALVGNELLGGRNLFVLDPSLDILASVSLEGSASMDKSTPIALDMDSDGRLEIIVAFEDKIYCFEYDGISPTLEKEWDYSTSSDPTPILEEGITTNVVGGGAISLRAQYDDYIPPRDPTGCMLDPSHADVPTHGTQLFTATCYDDIGTLNCPELYWETSPASLGSMNPGYTSPQPNPTSTFQAGSTAGSGWVEARYNSSLHCTAAVRVTSPAIPPNIVGTPLAVSTRGVVGGMDIVFADDEGNIYMLDSGGSLIWKKNYGSGETTASPIMSKNEIVFQGSNGIFGVDFEGSLLWQDNNAAGSLTPSLVDVNGDGLLEVVAANTGNNDVIVYGDATPPAVDSVSSKPVVVGGKASISVDVSDDNSGVESVEATVGSATAELSFNEDSGLWEGTLTAPSSAGRHTITVKAWDNTGNGPAVNNRSSLLVYWPDDGEEKRFHVDIEVGCAKEQINVTVTRRDEGVKGATVKLLYYDGRYWTKVDENETDNDGNATLMPPFEGDYELTVKRSGYRTETETFSIDCTFEPTPPENESYSVQWLPIEDKEFQAGQKSSFTATVKNNGSENAHNIAFSVTNCPSGWSCGIAPRSLSLLEPGETFEVNPWFIVPEDENATEKYLLLQLVVGPAKDYASFRAAINVTEGDEVDEWMKKAYGAIDAAKDEVDKAEAEGKDITDAGERLIEAQDAYAEGDYQTAYMLALEAQELAKSAGPKEEEEEKEELDLSILAGISVIIIVALIVAAYLVLSKKKEEEAAEKEEKGGGEERAGKTEMRRNVEEELGEIERKGLGEESAEKTETEGVEEEKKGREERRRKRRRKRRTNI